MRPPHLVLDEPTAQLDPEGTRLVGEALRQLAETGTAMLLVEHKTDLLDALCERVVVVDDGTLVADGPTADILDDPRLEALGRGAAEPLPGSAGALAAAGSIRPRSSA